MADLKTKPSGKDVIDFIDSRADTEQKKEDSLKLLQLLTEFSGYEPRMWGDSIIGFGQYHYKSERSRQEGDWPLVGFSPRKAAISLYVYSACAEQDALLAELGKFKMGKACIYVKRLSDINPDVLKKLVKTTIEYLNAKYH